MARYFRSILLIVLLFGVGLSPLFSGEDTTSLERLGHVGIPVSNLQNALHFYRDQLGLKEAFRLKKPDGSVWLVYLRVNSSNSFVELFPVEKKSTEVTLPQVYHLGFFVKDLQATLRTLQARGYHLPDDAFKQAAKLQADGSHIYFIKDPDGHRIELSQLTPVSLELRSSHTVN